MKKKELAKATAQWWRSQLTCARHDNGDNSFSSILSGILADTIAMKNEPTVDQLDKFEEVLTNALLNDDSPTIFLDCDYNPCRMLSEAAEAAGINTMVFPWKTNSRTTETELLVSEGYGSSYRRII